MKTQQKGEAAGWHAFDVVQAFNDGELPGRALHVQGARHRSRREDAQLTPVSRLRQAYMANVIFQVEVLVFHPVGIVQPVGCVLQPSAEQRGAAQTTVDVTDDVLVPNQPIGSATLVAYPQAAYHHWLVGGVGIEELCVQRGQLFHG
ncbi:hypothetical protein FQZ97_934120 [compost metagenome]